MSNGCVGLGVLVEEVVEDAKLAAMVVVEELAVVDMVGTDANFDFECSLQ